jgi:hypothetical protein
MDTKHYFEVTHGKTHKVFGPYPTIQAARKASFFYKDPNAYHRAVDGGRRNGAFAFATCGYEDAELAGAASDPAAFGYSRWIVKPVAPMHAGWKQGKYGAEFRATYFADCYKSTFGEQYEE